MTALRVFAIGGLLSYRALFSWLNPQLFVIVLLVPAVTQIFFFAYLGRAAGVEDDAFYVVGNALIGVVVPCVFGMTQTISDERYTHTLASLIVSPASRVALFLGRAIPVTANGAFVSAFAFVVGATVFQIHVSFGSLGVLPLAIVVTALSCTGLGLVNASLGLRWRETAVLSLIIYDSLLIFAGVNVPLELLPGWLSTLAQGIPVTHGAEAARQVVDGASFTDVSGLLGAELAVGLAYTAVGLTLLRAFEWAARRGAALEVA